MGSLSLNTGAFLKIYCRDNEALIVARKVKIALFHFGRQDTKTTSFKCFFYSGQPLSLWTGVLVTSTCNIDDACFMLNDLFIQSAQPGEEKQWTERPYDITEAPLIHVNTNEF